MSEEMELRAEIARLCDALRGCREVFHEIRMDWHDPRADIRTGNEIIDAALSRYPDNVQGGE